MSGSTIGDYELLNCIAAGSQSQIWEVVQAGGHEHYVMKLLLPQAFEDREAVQTMRHEAKVGTSFEHPNIIVFHEFTATKTEAFIVMEYFRGPNLKTAVKTDLEGLQTRLRRVMEGACLALAEMHEHGWVHKDVKPDNILSNRAGEVKLIDFALSVRVQSGLGKLFGGAPKSIQGTRTYIAPETIRKRHATPATDVYSLGVTLFEVVAGTPPFKGSSPNDLLRRHLSEPAPPPSNFNPNVTAELDQLVTRMLAKKPENRPQSMTELYGEMRSIPMFREAITPKGNKDEYVDNLGPGTRLDSRTDAMRTSEGGSRPKRAETKPAPPQPTAAPAPPPASAPVASQAPVPQQPGQYPPPGQFPPGQYPPGQYPPPQPYPQAPPGYAQPPVPQPYPPGYGGQPGQPPMPPQQAPYPPQPSAHPVQPNANPPQPVAPPPAGQGAPAQPQAPQQPAPPRQSPPQPPAATPGPPAQRPTSSAAPPVRRPPQPQAPKPPEADEEELPLMTDLPDII